MNRYDEYDDLEVPTSNPHLPTNIKQLRIEKRMTQRELGDALNVDEQMIKEWESGNLIPTTSQIIKLCSILRIGHYDMMTRDILSERNEAEKSLKKSKSRGNYDWYYGSKKRIILDIVYLISMPIIYMLVLLIAKSYVAMLNESLKELEEIGQIEPISEAIAYIYALLPVGFITGIIVTIKLVLKYRIAFQWWMIFFFSIALSLILIVGTLGAIPYYIYVIVNLITKRGKNHL